MATVEKSNNAEIGVATGTTLTAGNSGGGSQNAFAAVNVGAGNTLTVSSVSPLAGTYSYLLSQGGANPLEIYWSRAVAGANFAFQCRFVHKTPAVNNNFFRTYAATDFLSGLAFAVFQRTDNKYHIFDANSSTQSPSSTGVLVDGTTYMFQLYYAAGSVTMNIYPIASTTPTVTITMAVGVTNIGSCRIGIPTPSVLTSFRIDNLKMGADGFLARDDVSNVAPTASVGPDQYVPVGTVVTLTGTDNDTDGSVASRAWTWSTSDTSGPASTTRKWAAGPTITGSTTQNATATMATAGAYRAQYIVTDSDGATSTAVYSNVFVYPASGGDVAVRNAVKGSWTRTGGSDDTAVLNDGNTATGHTSVDDPTGQVDTLLMMPHGPGTGSGAITLKLNSNTTGGTANITVAWYKSDGSSLLGSHTQVGRTTLGDQTFTLPGGGLTLLGSALSDRAELVVKISAAI